MGYFYETKDGIPEINNLKEEVKTYREILNNYNITFNDLTNSSPKCPNIRKIAIKISKFIAENDQLATYLIQNKQLPVKELEELVSISHKTLTRHRNYIIALSLIYIGEFTYLKCYIKN